MSINKILNEITQCIPFSEMNVHSLPFLSKKAQERRKYKHKKLQIPDKKGRTGNEHSNNNDSHISPGNNH